MKKLILDGKDISNMLYIGDQYINVPFPEPVQINYFLVGGGGGGGSAENNVVTYQPGGAGGGAGGITSGSILVESFSSHDITVGEGGSGGSGGNFPGNNGQDTTFQGITALGGGGGGAGNGGSPASCAFHDGKNGGSGGGAGATPGALFNCNTGSGLQPTSTDGGFGNDGYVYPDINSTLSGGGGGAGGPAVSNVGGSGYLWHETGETYAVGGTANSAPANNTTSGSGGYGGVYGANKNGRSGLDGLAIIWYEGPPRGFGGTITQANGNTYHTFVSSSAIYLYR
jgi:hypothetical protein